MTCKATQHYLYEAERLDALPAEVASHLDSCRSCRACRDDLATMLGSLANDSELPALPDGFELSLRRKLNEAAAERPAAVSTVATTTTARRQPRVLALVAMAAAVLLAVGVWTVWRPGATPPATHHRLHLSVDATQHHREARFEITLPPGVTVAPELAGALASSTGTVTWRSPLRPGHNEIDLPLVRRGASTAIPIRAQLLVDGHRVGTEVELGAGSSETARGAGPRLTLAIAALGPGPVEVTR